MRKLHLRGRWTAQEPLAYLNCRGSSRRNVQLLTKKTTSLIFYDAWPAESIAVVGTTTIISFVAFLEKQLLEMDYLASVPQHAAEAYSRFRLLIDVTVQSLPDAAALSALWAVS